MRTCSKCKTEKEKSDFSKRKKSKDGLNRQCKKCVNDARKKWEARRKSCNGGSVVKVSGHGYFCITSFLGTYNNNTVSLEASPWYGDSTAAEAFATALGYKELPTAFPPPIPSPNVITESFPPDPSTIARYFFAWNIKWENSPWVTVNPFPLVEAFAYVYEEGNIKNGSVQAISLRLDKDYIWATAIQL